MIFRLAFASGAFLVLFLIADRIVAAALPIHQFGWFRQVDDDDVFYEPVPGIRYGFMGNVYSHNALRMRDAEERGARGDGRRRVAFVGDSVCYGSRVDDGGPMSAVAERELASADGGRGVECLNFGVPGFNAHQVRHHAEQRLGEFDGIGTVVYVVSENDLVNACFEYATHRLPWVLYSRYQPPSPLWKFWLRRSAIVSVAHRHLSGYPAVFREQQASPGGARPAAPAGDGTPPAPGPAPSAEASAPRAYDATTTLLRSLMLADSPLRRRFAEVLGELSEVCRARGASLVVLYVPSEQTLALDRDGAWAAELRRLTETARARFLDGTDALRGQGHVYADNGHPDARGHALLGKAVARWLRER